MIRSSEPILKIHEAVKSQLVQQGVDRSLLQPLIGNRSPELKLAGEFKQKDQDVCVVPADRTLQQEEVMTGGLLAGVTDPYGQQFTTRILAVNVRSQISSIQKNFDTLYERTFSEAINLHERCNEMVLGEVYMIAVPEYDDQKVDAHKVAFKTLKPDLVEKYIKSFQAITNRQNTGQNFYKYEVTCLLIVDFQQDPPKIYHSTKELINEGLLPANTTVRYEGLEWANFSKKLLSIHAQRFGNGCFT